MARHGCIYFMQMQNADGYVKIGFSENVAKRLSSIQVGSPYKIEVIALLANESQTMEGIIHTILVNSWIKGEWFRPTEEVLECIENVKNNNFGLFIRNAVHSNKI